jgi:hypothetical protein
MTHRFVAIALLLTIATSGVAQVVTKPAPNTVEFVVTSASSADGAIRWAITNHSDGAVFVYDFFLWGPALSVDSAPEKTTFNTTPVVEQASCGPNRFPPVLLLVVAPGRTITGELKDQRITPLSGKAVSARIAVGLDAYSVVREAKRFMESNCKHSPYDAIVRWGRIVESKATTVQ